MRRSATAFVPLLAGAMLIAGPRSTAPVQAAGVAASEAPSGAGQIEKEILAIEQQEAQALLRGDAPALERLWAQDLLVTASNNTIRTGAEALGYVRSGQLRLTKLDRRVERVAVHGQVAIAMGVETLIPAGGGNAGKTLHRRYTDVYAQQDGQWRLIARQQTLIPANP